ncbi:hypothetical protein HYPSUDRAFT_204637 [Hypholoma sublateritium FD-334 SS-4]|uniref:Uncharacterized protein n=1 Tax=Hypholoma sublateritium (strain FD-334 SS-4) TaxID=945553 RepID=A0A0D2KY12_HYPSF|nr:hypothetical protein HYPSUDRAFT_204637 [Hypholoma sublateritium FD-334 SS-4]
MFINILYTQRHITPRRLGIFNYLCGFLTYNTHRIRDTAYARDEPARVVHTRQRVQHRHRIRIAKVHATSARETRHYAPCTCGARPQTACKRHKRDGGAGSACAPLIRRVDEPAIRAPTSHGPYNTPRWHGCARTERRGRERRRTRIARRGVHAQHISTLKRRTTPGADASPSNAGSGAKGPRTMGRGVWLGGASWVLPRTRMSAVSMQHTFALSDVQRGRDDTAPGRSSSARARRSTNQRVSRASGGRRPEADARRRPATMLRCAGGGVRGSKLQGGGANEHPAPILSTAPGAGRVAGRCVVRMYASDDAQTGVGAVVVEPAPERRRTRRRHRAEHDRRLRACTSSGGARRTASRPAGRRSARMGVTTRRMSGWRLSAGRGGAR